MSVQNPPRLVSIKFSINEDALPSELLKLKRDGFREVKFHSGATGIKHPATDAGPVQSCSLAEFLRDLGPLGYEFVNASYERRPDPNGGKKIYHTACYFFAPRAFANASKDFEVRRYTLRQELEILCEEAMYAVRSIWDNPFYGPEGEEVEGARAFEVNLNGRQPLTDADGRPLLVWQDKTKQAKVPLKAKNCLRMMLDGAIEILSM